MANKKRPTSVYEDPVEYSAGQYNAVTPTLSDQDCIAFQFDSSGNLLVKQVNAGSGSNPAAGATGSAVPLDADYAGINIAGNLTGQTGHSLTNAKAADVAIVDGSGNQITSFGGGTQFADSAASGLTPTGTLSMGWDSANSKVRALKVDASQNLDVAVAAALPAGTNVIGHVIVDTAPTTPVTGTFFQVTQPVSIAATVPVQVVGNAAVLSGQQAVTASAVALASNACRKVAIKALVANSINVYIGPAGITTATGYELAPGEVISLDVTNTSLISVIASATGASVSWVATN